jgi:rod shape determining protein RodA
LFGRGLGAGSQSQLQFLPEAATDFAFALIAEELGFAGAFILLATFALLFARIGFHLARAPDNFARYVLAGIGGWWAFQVCVYVGMNMGLAPIIGIPLPFVSYGGSSLLASFLAAGCLLVVSNASTAERGV